MKENNNITKEIYVAGCKHFSGRETYHHKDCPHYEDSLSEMYNKQTEERRAKNEAIYFNDAWDEIQRESAFPIIFRNIELCKLIQEKEQRIEELEAENERLIRLLEAIGDTSLYWGHKAKTST
jgi:hypothetical protein